MHLLCPHCHNPIELGELTLSQEITCPACGSGIRLAAGSTQAAPPRSLGRFELQTSLGAGAFGVVYKARDPAMDRVVALKVPRAGDLAEPAERERFLREARSAAQLRHPGIVTIHEVGQADGVPFLVSEFVEGVTLTDLLSARRPTPREAARLVAEAAEALHYAHQRGVVHRDVKPSNLMVTTDADGTAHVKVMDFGLARRDAGEVTLTMEGHILGTPAYMPPEQARGEGHRVDGRSDVYSLGVVLYQLLTGELPFRGTTRMLLHQVLQDEPRSPRSLNDTIPRDLETACLKAMAKEPGRRYQTAKELADDLRRWLNGEPIVARPVGRVEKLWRWCRRNPAVASLLALVFLSLVGGIAVSTYYAGVADRRAREAEENERRADREADEARAQERLARRHLYAANCNLADAAWHGGNTGRVVRLLEALKSEAGKEDLRGFEWRYLDQLSHDYLHTLTGHKGALHGLAFSPDGRTLASASSDGTVKLWDTVRGRELLTLPEAGGAVHRVAFRPDGVLTTAGDGGIRFWDPASGKPVGACRGSSRTGVSLAFTGDGKRLLTGGVDGVVQLWDAKSGEEVRSFRGHSAAVTALTLLPDGQGFVSYGEDGTARLWRLEGGAALHVSHFNAGRQLKAFSPDGRLLAAASGGAVRAWKVESGELIYSSPGHGDFVHVVAFSPDGRWLASCGHDRMVRIWHSQTGRFHRLLRGHVWGVTRLAIAPDGRRLATSDIEGTIRIFDRTTGTDLRVLRGHSGHVRTVAFDPVRPRLASAGADGLIRLWDCRSSQPLNPLPGHTAQVLRVAYSPDGRLLASAGVDRTIRLWDADTGRPLGSLEGHKAEVRCLAFRPDGRQLASGGGDQVVRIWDVDSGKELRTIRGQAVPTGAVAYSPDGHWLALGGGDDGNDAPGPSKLFEVRVWDVRSPDVRTWKEARCLIDVAGHRHDRAISGLVFHPDGRHLVSSGCDDILLVWDFSEGRLVHYLHAHDAQIYGVAVSPNGRRFASGGVDQTVKIWDAGSGHDLITLRGHTGPVAAAAFSPDGHLLASASFDGTVRLWDARPRTSASRDEREALGLLDFLFDVPLLKEEVLERIRAEQTINEDVRRLALELAAGYRENLARIHEACVTVVTRPGLPEAELKRVSRLLERASEVEPGNTETWALLGHARYRSGDATGAVAAFARAGQLHPMTLAVVAMAQFRAGQTEQAKTTLARVRASMKLPEVAGNPHTQRLLNEAETLLEAKKKP